MWSLLIIQYLQVTMKEANLPTQNCNVCTPTALAQIMALQVAPSEECGQLMRNNYYHWSSELAYRNQLADEGMKLSILSF